MKKKLLFITLLAIFSILSATEKMVVRFNNPTKEIISQFNYTNSDIAAYKPDNFLDIVVTTEEFEELKNAGYNIKIQMTEKEMKNNMKVKSERDLPGYHTYEQTVEILNEIETNHPDIAKVYDIGDTWGKIYAEDGNSSYDDYNHEVLAIKISDNVEIEEDEPSFYSVALHHSREPISTEVTLNNLQYIIENYQTNPEIEEWINSRQIWFIPIVNPNGHKIVTDQQDLWWRKNISDNDENGNFNSSQDGVDPNRNYGWEWGLVGASDDWSSDTYHGTEPFSEPSVQAVKQMVEDHHFIAGISYHSYSELVLYPYGYGNGSYAPDKNAIEDLGESMAATIPCSSGGGYYNPQNAWELYPCMGTTDDWTYGEHGIFSYTIELAQEFIPPANQVQGICDDNLEAFKILIRRSDDKMLTGHVTNSQTNESIVAEIEIPEIDNTGAFKKPYYSNEEFGTYYRLLMPGEYNVTYKAFGFENFETTVTITEDGITEQDVSLNPINNTTVTGLVKDSDSYEPIQGAKISFLNTPIEDVFTDENGEFIINNVPMSTFDIQVSAENYGSFTQEYEITENINLDFTLFAPFFIDSFEENAENWNLSGVWGISDNQANNGTHSLADSPNGDYSDNLDISAELGTPIELSDAISASFSFAAKYSIESGYDYCYLEIKPSSSSTWEEKFTFSGSADWEIYEVQLNEYIGENVQVRFRFESDGSVTEDGIYIDDFTIFKAVEVSNDNNIIEIPTKLQNNYPNPFNLSSTRNLGTTIAFSISPEDKNPTIEIFNLKGQKIRSFSELETTDNRGSINWNGTNKNNKKVGSGVYFYRLKTSNKSISKKMLIIK